MKQIVIDLVSRSQRQLLPRKKKVEQRVIFKK